MHRHSHRLNRKPCRVCGNRALYWAHPEVRLVETGYKCDHATGGYCNVPPPFKGGRGLWVLQNTDGSPHACAGNVYSPPAPTTPVVEPVRTPVVTQEPVTVETPDDGPLAHYVLPKVLSALNAGCHVYLVGGAGGGKTTLMRQAFEAFYGHEDSTVLSVGPDTRGFRLFGWRSPTTGEYMSGPFRSAMTNGHGMALDEIDTAHPSVMPEANAAIANGHYLFADDVEVTAHERFRVILGANTYGRGADAQYVGRSPIDGASLDRFAFITVDYDEYLTRRLCGLPGGKQRKLGPYAPRTLTIDERELWVARVGAIRAAVTRANMRLIVSPRAEINGMKLLSQGWLTPETEDALIWRGISRDDRLKLAV